MTRLSHAEARRATAHSGEAIKAAISWPIPAQTRMRALTLTLVLATTTLGAQTQSADWPVYGGSTDHTHYTTIDQITPANVIIFRSPGRTRRTTNFPGSEMQANPIVVDGVLTRRPRSSACSRSTRRRARRSGASTERRRPPASSLPASRRRRHRRPRPVHVSQQALGARQENRAADPVVRRRRRGGFARRTRSAARGAVGEREHAGRRVRGYAHHRQHGERDACPGRPATFARTTSRPARCAGAFTPFRIPGEFGYETWPPDVVQGQRRRQRVGRRDGRSEARRWSSPRPDRRRSTSMAANRIGDNLFANTRPRARRAHGQAHLALPGREARPVGLGFPRGAGARHRDARRTPVDAVAQITKTGYVYVFERETGKPLFPIEYRNVPASPLDGEQAAATQPFPVSPPPFTRQTLTEDMITTRTPEAHAAALKMFREYKTTGMFDPPNLEGTIIFPGVDGGGEWGGPAFDPATGLLYVNSNEMPWLPQARSAQRQVALRLELRELPRRRPQRFAAIVPRSSASVSSVRASSSRR